MGAENSDYFAWLTSSEVRQALNEIGDSTDRAAAVLAGALLEDQLIRLLERSTLDDLKDFRLRVDRSLGFSDHCTWAYRLGLIDEDILAELRILGRIRNEFAHNWASNLSFESGRVADLVGNLRSPNNVLDPKSPYAQYPDIATHRMLVLSSKRWWWSTAVGGLLSELRERGDNAAAPQRPQSFRY